MRAAHEPLVGREGGLLGLVRLGPRRDPGSAVLPPPPTRTWCAGPTPCSARTCPSGPADVREASAATNVLLVPWIEAEDITVAVLGPAQAEARSVTDATLPGVRGRRPGERTPPPARSAPQRGDTAPIRLQRCHPAAIRLQRCHPAAIRAGRCGPVSAALVTAGRAARTPSASRATGTAPVVHRCPCRSDLDADQAAIAARPRHADARAARPQHGAGRAGGAVRRRAPGRRSTRPSGPRCCGTSARARPYRSCTRPGPSTAPRSHRPARPADRRCPYVGCRRDRPPGPLGRVRAEGPETRSRSGAGRRALLAVGVARCRCVVVGVAVGPAPAGAGAVASAVVRARVGVGGP